MTGYLDKAQVEIVDYFRALGYGYAHGPAKAPERANYGKVALLRYLQNMLH